ncbi:MAG: hypothetical protein FJX42_10125 [Alphaproteobacteria bacterium]|nr:hypothetical protein [Alphaproteobacteria bacterium]
MILRRDISGFLALLAVALPPVAGGAAAEPSAKKTSAPAAELALHDPLPREEEPAGPGVRAGPFLLFPVVGLSETYDDNIFAAHSGKKDDFVRTVAPSLTAVAEDAERLVRLRAGGHAGFYKWHSSENFLDVHASAEGAANVSPETRNFGGGWIGRDHEERESTDEAFGREPTRYFDFKGYAGVRRRAGPLTLTFGGRAERLDFRDTATSTAPINNDDRDRNLLGGGAQVSFAATNGFEPFVQAGAVAVRYDDRADDNGLKRDSNGLRLVAGARIQPTPSLLVTAFAGLMTQDYDDARLKDIRRPALGAALNWTLAPATRLSAIVNRGIEETTLNRASGEIGTAAALVLRQDFGERLAAHLRIGAGRGEFPGIGREDDAISAGGTLTWRMNSRFFLIGEYHRTDMTSNAANESYRRNRVMIGLEGRF